MEIMVSGVEDQKAVDSVQLIHIGTDSEAPEQELVELGEFSIMH